MSTKRALKQYDGVSVLIFGAGGRQALPVCRGFYKLGCKVTAYCYQKTDTGYLTRFATEKILYDSNNALKEDFMTYGARLIKKGKFDLVVPLGDLTANFLSQHKIELEEYAKIAVNDWGIFQYAIDKSKTMHVCMKYGIDAPITIESDDPVSDIEKGTLDFPVVVKPCIGLGSIGFSIIRNMASLKDYLQNHQTSGKAPILIQEYVEQGNEPQYRVDLFRDRNGAYKAGIVGKVTRWFPLDGGSGIFAETIHNEEILDNCKRLLDVINWNGYANLDLVWDIKVQKAKVLEINGRTGATIMEDYYAGINVSQLILENELGFDVTDMNSYEDGSRISCFLPDLLWFIKSPNRFKTKPSWFKRRGVKDTVFFWDDPLPFFGFLLTSVGSFRESMIARKRV